MTHVAFVSVSSTNVLGLVGLVGAVSATSHGSFIGSDHPSYAKLLCGICVAFALPPWDLQKRLEKSDENGHNAS